MQTIGFEISEFLNFIWEKMKLLAPILLISYVQSKESTIECSDCYYSYVEVDGYITPLKGDQNCMTNPKSMKTKNYPREGTKYGKSVYEIR